MMKDFTIPEQMNCFKYHYPIYIPAKYHDGTPGYDFTNYITTGECKENLQFDC